MGSLPDERRKDLDDAVYERGLQIGGIEALREQRDELAATIERQRPVIEAAERVSRQNSATASRELQVALSKLDFALDRLAALSEGDSR